MNQPIIIVGFMGSGKTTVARKLARILNCVAIDLDNVIAQRTGRTAREIIEADGEPAFRSVETRTLSKVLDEGSGRVIALGGGAWIEEENRQLVTARNGFSVWIDAPFELCWGRIEAAGNERPLAPNRELAEKLYAQRRPVYALATLRVAVREDDSSRAAVTIANGVSRDET